ncbi:MAG: PAS domain S-box protein [Candidatus Anammoxibacter sp.]
MPIKLNNIFAKTILPIIGVFAVGIFALILFISQINKQSAIEMATINAKSTIRQYMTLRSYYTKNVVKKVRSRSNLQVTFDHKIRENAIPLPATLIQDLSSLLADSEGMRLMLYSAFPFPNHEDRVLDDFAKEAIAYFKTNPDGTFVKTVLIKDNETVRVAIADKMVDDSCVTCHNNHPQTPKKGWKLGDVRGVLEVVVPINYQISANRDVSIVMSYIIGLMFIIIVASILFLFKRSITNPIKKLSNMSLQVADGNLDTKIDIKSKDEIGSLADSFNRMTQNLQKTTVSKDYVDNIIKNMLDTLVVLGLDLEIRRANQATLTLLGYEEDELIGKPVTIIFAEESTTTSVINDLITKDIKSISTIYLAKDNRKIPVLFSSSVMRDDQGNVQGIICVALDITGYKLMEEKLIKSKRRFAGILDIAEDAIVTINEAQQIIIFNKGAENIFGYSSDEVIGKPLEILIPARFAADHQTNVRKFGHANIDSKRMGERQYELVGRRKNGEEFPAEASISQLKEGNQKIFTAVLRDISERKKSEKILDNRRRAAELGSEVGIALTHNEHLDEMLQCCTEAIVKHLDAAFARIWILNKDKNILELQASAGMYTHIDGQHKCIPVGKYKIGLIAEERHPYLTNSVIGDSRVHDQEWAKREGMVAFAGCPLIVENRLKGVMAMFARKQLPDSALQAMKSIANGIALGIERKDAEDHIRKLTTSIEQSPGIVVITDINGNVEYVNPRFTALTGYSSGEVMGKNPRILKSGKQSHGVYQRLWSTIISGNEWKGELHNRKKNGELYWESVCISPVRNKKNIITNFIKDAEDITRRKETEEKLVEYREHLEELIEERSKELKTTYEQLVHSEKLGAIGKLSASIAHEFNNPIYGIRNVLEIVKGKTAIIDEKITKDFVDMAIKECDRMSDLIGKLQDFHRPSSGEKASMDIHKAIDDTLLLARKELESKNISLEKDYAANMPKIEVVPDQIKQVILNLINNAKAAIDEEKGGEIKIITEIVGRNIKIHVQDNGCGINDQDIKLIFDPFFSTKGIKGTGLGLSISYGIIKQHGGEITVKSRTGIGTTFTVTLPIRNLS